MPFTVQYGYAYCTLCLETDCSNPVMDSIEFVLRQQL
jgi:hypothetical protein